MNYELAKQLKDAGLTGAKYQRCWKDHYHIKNCEYYPNPTLSELIEACQPKSGEEFALIVTFAGDFAASNRYWDIDSHQYFALHEEIAETADEAVARLWLSLNSPK